MITVFIDRGPKEASTFLSASKFELITHQDPEIEAYRKELKEDKEFKGEPKNLKAVLIQPQGKGSSKQYIYTSDRCKILSAGTLLKDI